jgi:cell division protein FtsN/TolA-binding protein
MMRSSSLLGAGLLLVAGALVPGRAVAQGDPAQLLASGRSAYEAGQYEKARAELWAYLEATANLSGASRLPQAEALFTIAQMEPDAAVAAQHYTTIATEYPAATVADEALFRLGMYALVTGRPSEARTRFLELKQNYPFSRFQGEVPLWVGRTFLAEGSFRAATDAFIEGFSRIRMQDLPYELPAAQRDALAAEYAYWLANAFHEEGDEQTAIQYWSLLALDYSHSPQAAEARAALAALGRPVAEPGGRVEATPAPADEPLVLEPAREPAEELELPAEEPPVLEPPRREEPVVQAPPPREEPVFRPTPRREEPVAPPPSREPPVETPARPAAAEEAPKFPPPSAGTAWLQVGAFTSAARAADLSKRLRADGFQSAVEIGIVDGQGFYRVRVGPYRLPVEEEALRATEARLRQMGYSSQRIAAGS